MRPETLLNPSYNRPWCHHFTLAWEGSGNQPGDEMEASGKNEYVLTQDDVENFSPSDIEKSFNQPMEDEDDELLNRYNS